MRDESDSCQLPSGLREVPAVSKARRRWRAIGVTIASCVFGGLGSVALWMHDGSPPASEVPERDRDAWQRQVEAQSARVEAARLKMLNVAEGAHIIDLALWNRLVTDKPPHLSAGGAKEKAEEAIHNLAWQLEILHVTEGEELLRTAAMMGDLGPSPLEDLWPTYQAYQQSLAQWKRVGLGPRHPEVRAVEGRLTKIKERMAAAVESIKETLRAKLELGRQALKVAESLEGRSPELTEGLKSQMKDYDKFVEAKEDYERQRKRLAHLRERDSKEAK